MFFTFPQPQHVLNMFLNFGHFSAARSYKSLKVLIKWFFLKKECTERHATPRHRRREKRINCLPYVKACLFCFTFVSEIFVNRFASLTNKRNNG